MVVRGAPAIGVAAAMGIALGAQNSKAETVADLKRDLDQICDVIGKDASDRGESLLGDPADAGEV
jgi:methylthioribose-1-phosphate isomerase